MLEKYLVGCNSSYISVEVNNQWLLVHANCQLGYDKKISCKVIFYCFRI